MGNSSHRTELEVWYDGECRLCRQSREWCEYRDRHRRLRFRDSRDDSADLPVSFDEAETSMWVKDRHGLLFEGFEAWRRLLAELPGWRWLAKLSGVPPFTWLGPRIYRVVARHRRLLQ